MTNELNDPNEYNNMPEDVQEILQEWIEKCVNPFKTKSFVSQSSYYIKHLFTEATGIYITNGQMKGGLLAAGFDPKNTEHVNWIFKFSKKAALAH